MQHGGTAVGLKVDSSWTSWMGTWRNTSLAILIVLLQFWRSESGTSNLWNWTSTLKELIDSTIDCSGWSVVELLYKGAHADALPNLSEPCWIDWSQRIDWIEPTMDIWSCETSCEITKAEISIESVTEPGRTQRPWPTCYHTQTWTCPEYFEYFELIWICLICFSCDWCDWSGSSHPRTVATVATCSCAWSICWLFLLCQLAFLRSRLVHSAWNRHSWKKRLCRI